MIEPVEISIPVSTRSSTTEQTKGTEHDGDDRQPRRTRRRWPDRADRAADLDAAGLHRLRDGGHRRPGPARRPRRPEAGAPPGALRDVRRRLPARPRLLQVLARGRRRDGPVPPARRHGDLRHPGPAGPAVGDARPADPRPGQLRLTGQRLRGRDALHRVPDGSARARDGARHRPGHRRLPAQLRRPLAGADDPAVALPEPAGQRLGRDRRRHGHQHPAAQPARGGRRRPVGARAPRRDPRGAPGRPDRADQGPRLPQRRADRGPRGHRAGLPHRPRVGHPACGDRGRRGQQGPHLPLDHRAALHGQPRQPGPEDRRARRQRQGPGHRRRARRLLRPHGPAAGGRAEARRGRPRGAEQPAQAHRAADQLLGEHAGAGRLRAAHAHDRPVHQQLGGAPDRGHPAAHAVPAGGGRAPRPRPAWSGQGARRARRGDRAHPPQPRRRRRRARA